MKTNDMLAVIDREAQILMADNWHAASAVMKDAAERLRVLAARLRRAGLGTEDED